jgi:hypothetical protein
MGRKRQHKDDAAKQKAYRSRKQRARFALLPGGGKADPEALREALDNAIEEISQRLAAGRGRRAERKHL